MKILIIGSTQYYNKFLKHKKRLEKQGHKVKLPILDERKDLNDLEICEQNLKFIKWADEVHMIWDRRSMGTVLDFGMTLALGKKFKIVYLEPKTLWGAMKKYENKFHLSRQRNKSRK